MFCCTRKQSHFGQIITLICLQQQCTKSKNQLLCSLCLQQQHKNHSINTMKKIMPEFLLSFKQKQKYLSMLNNLLNFTIENFGEENDQGENIVVQNLVDRVIGIMTDLKIKMENNNQEVLKMKQIFKNLNKNSNQNSINNNFPTKSQVYEVKKQSNQKNNSNINSPTKTTKSAVLGLNSNTKYSNSKSMNNYNNGTIDTFSHSLKHPYLTISNNNHTVLKPSHPGHRYAILTSKSLSPHNQQNQIQIKIDSCPSGNIMLGLCHQQIIKQKDFTNTYGTNQGTYLIGQNGLSQSAISFHHSINMMNRKQIVGWNFIENDILVVGFDFKERFVYFKLNKAGKTKDVKEFTMKLISEDIQNKDIITSMVEEDGLKVVVLLQNVGDQVTLLEI